MDQLTLYAIPVSLYCAKLRIVLRHKQLKWKEVAPPGGYGSVEYARIVPSGSLPALLTDDVLLADSEAIAEYLNEKYPPYPLLAKDIELRAKTRELSRFHDTRLEPELRVLFAQIAPATRDAAVIIKQTAMLNLRLQALSQLLAGSVEPRSKRGGGAGSFQAQLTLGDCGFAISFLWIRMLSQAMGFDITWPDRVLEYANHIQTFAAVSEELTDYEPKLKHWLASAINS